MGRLEGKIALITGGSEGIGFGTAEQFLREGATVYITGRRQNVLDAAVAQLGEGATGIVADAGRLEDLDRMFAIIKREQGRLDVLFTNAGVYPAASISSFTEEDYDRCFDINVKGVFFCMQKALPLMDANGSILLNASFLAGTAYPGMCVYSASKAAVLSLARGFTAELRGTGPRVNVISPGPIHTPGNRSSLAEIPQVLAAVTGMVPRGRIGEAVDIARAAVFLASDEASFIAGTELLVDGGIDAL